MWGGLPDWVRLWRAACVLGGGCFDGLDCGLDLSLAGQIVAGQVVKGGVEGGKSFALVGGGHRSVAVYV